MNKNFKKNLVDMTKEDWEDLYQYRSRIGSFYSNSINSAEKLEYFYRLSLKQEETVKKYLEELGYKVEFLDKDRECIFAFIQNHGTPDLLVDGKFTVEVKNFYLTNYRSNKRVKLNFRANVCGLDETSMKEAVWKKDFHDADYVFFITPECDNICYSIKCDDVGRMKIVGHPDNALNCKQRILAYLPVSDLTQL